MNAILLDRNKLRFTQSQQRNDLCDTKLITRLLVIISFLLCGLPYYAEGQTVSPPVEMGPEPISNSRRSSESFSGTLKIVGSDRVTLITAAKIFHLEGPIVPHLLKEHDKQWRIEGHVVDGGTLEVTYAVPLRKL
jgi:hypothetical protein